MRGIRINYTSIVIFLMILSACPSWAAREIVYADNQHLVNKFIFPPDTIYPDSTQSLPYPLPDETFPYTGDQGQSPILLTNPSNITEEVNFDPETGLYKIEYKLGDIEYRPPAYMTLDEYREYDLGNAVDQYWKERSSVSGMGTRDGIIPSIYIGGKAFDRVFGGNTVDIRPAGDVTLFFGVRSSYSDDVNLDERQKRQTNFDFDEDINMSVTANIGEKISFTTNYNTQATFDFENKLKLAYEGDEDEILQLVEAGNVSLPLQGTLITGSQSLFGIKTKMKFGRTTVTTIFSEQETESQSISVQGGGMTTDFLIYANEYEENKYFFLSHFFRDEYEEALSELPLVKSGIDIVKLEVWVTNIGAAVTENRNVVAFTDLGEVEEKNINNKELIQGNLNAIFPDNYANNLFTIANDTNQIRNLNNVNNYLSGKGFTPSSDFEKIELAKKLSENEYTVNEKLGFISLNFPLNSDQALAVAFQYQVLGQDSTIFQVGEFSDQGIIGEKALIVKLIRGTYIDVRSPIWDLMMKNVYSLNAMSVNHDDFTLNILYEGDENGVPTGYFTDGPFSYEPLLEVFNLDNLNMQNEFTPDGMFDWVDGAHINGGTINASRGKVFFTVLEPFGEYLRRKFYEEESDENLAEELADKYCYDSLYTLTKTGAEKYTEKNKFMLAGFYKSEGGSDISLNAMNIPRGSVRVTAGGTELVENVDYTVDYTLGRVRIINEGILNSGTPINVSLESQNLLGLQTKRLMGTHIDYDISNKFHVGATAMNLSERPITQKVSYGNDPISNTIWGVDYAYQTESRLVTKIIDKIPFYSSAQESQVNMDGEMAHFIPGHHKSVGKEGTSYIDDFEGTKSTIDLKMAYNWFLASTPQFQADVFPEAQSNDLSYGFNRANITWYTIDPTVFYNKNNTLRPENVTNDDISNQYARQVLHNELFPDKDIDPGQPQNIAVMNVAFYPSERGPYNYDVEPGPYSAGLNPNGELNDPDSRWGGIMREIQTTDFEATNVEYIEFWLMDPFLDDSPNDGTGGELYFNLGDISEDILKDSRKFFEHGLPLYDTVNIDEYDTTQWGIIPDKLDIVQSFSNEPGSRQFQDVGYDGLNNFDEAIFYSGQNLPQYGYDYIGKIADFLSDQSVAYQNALQDPSGDDFHHFRGEDYDADPQYASVTNRYKRYGGVDGNSPEDTQSDYYAGNSRTPNVEDLNNDNTLNEAERYYQYKVVLKPERMNVGDNFITDIHEAQASLANGETKQVRWYQFKIPVKRPDKVVGNISDFKSIRFMRLYLKEFNSPVILRFATLDLVRGEWRTYPHSEDLIAPGEYVPSSTSNNTAFEMSAVSLEENGQKEPYPYVLPPGIEREMNVNISNLTQMNEQSMVMKVCDLVDGDVVAAYKTADFDFRQFKKLKMFVHAEQIGNELVKDGDLTIFLRIGSDFTQNYYEYEIPLKFTTGNTIDPLDIWPEENEFNVVFEKLVNAKHQRNLAMRDANSLVNINFPYYIDDGDNRITVLGNPSISDVKSMLIGIRNPRKSPDDINSDDDGFPKCAEIWVNELRLSDFNKNSGFAARSRIAMTLADLGNLSISGLYTSPWFASIDQQVTEIPLEGMAQFDVATNIDIGKLFPKNVGLSVPMHYDYSQTRISPKYNPLDPDIELQTVLDSYETQEQKDSLRSLTQDITVRKNLNFMNVRKNKVNAQGGGRGGPPMTPGNNTRGGNNKQNNDDKKNKNHFYDLSNLTASYSYSEIDHSNIDVEYDVQQTYMGSLNYSYNFNSKAVEPFKNIDFIKKSKSLQILKDFNFYFLPKSLAFGTNMNREYAKELMRSRGYGDIKLPERVNKSWDWQRNFTLAFDLTKALNFDFTSSALSFIREYPNSNQDPFDGVFNGEEINVTAEEKQQLVMDELRKGGTKSNYSHNASLNYTLPIKKIPAFDWINIQAGYQAQYQWLAAPLAFRDELGSTIANNRNYNLNGNADFAKFYKKFGFLKKLDSPKKKGNKNNSKGKKDNNKNNTSTQTPDSLNAEKKPGVDYLKIAYETTLRFITSVKKVTFQYSVNEGTTLPGFTKEPSYLGNDWDVGMPGLPFLFGDQPDGPQMFEQFITTSDKLNSQYIKQYNEGFNARVTMEPFKDFDIMIDLNRTHSSNVQSYYVYNPETNAITETNRITQGTFTMSFISWGTAFGGDLNDDKSQFFEDFKDYRLQIANELARRDPRSLPINDSTGYPAGYGPTSQNVLLPAFISAYSGRGLEEANFNIFSAIPLPNWDISYKGLTKIELFKRYFKTFTVDHQYTSTFNIGSFYTNVGYDEVTIGGISVSENINPLTGDFYAKYDYGIVMINEQFSPLLGLDMTLNNSLQLKIEFKKMRTLAMSFANNQLTEQKRDDYVVGMGYTFKDVPFKISTAGGTSKRTFKSDLNLRFNFSLSDDKVVLRNIDTDLNQISDGQKQIKIDFSADYTFSKSLTGRFIFSRSQNIQALATIPGNSETVGGIELVYTLQ